jgi:3-dehydroquinate dehydratase
MDRQLAAVTAGAVAIDMELDTFDPRPAPPLGTPDADRFAATAGEPAELSRDASAVARQRTVVASAHAAGAEVILSCHTGRPQTTAGLVAIVDEAVGRGADLVKIVTPCLDRADVLAVLEANARVVTPAGPPCSIIGAGDAGAISRFVGGAFGAAWLLGRPSGGANPFPGHPPIADLEAIIDRLPSGAAGRRSGRA